jgi:protein SCO1/2
MASRHMICSRRSLLLASFALGACHSTPPLPELGAVPAFSLESQEGTPFGSKQLEGCVWAVAFMFTRCPTVCPRITRFMQRLQRTAKSKGVDLRLLSISVDPDNDTPAVLKSYARRFDADLSSWTFLTGDFEAIKKTSEDGFKLALEGRADPAAKDFGIVHGSHLVLIDRHAKIRGYYRTDDEQEAARLLADAKRLSSKA